MPAIAKVLQQARQKLAVAEQTPNAALDAELLLAEVLAVERSYLYAHPEAEPSRAQLDRFNTLLQMRLAGEPIAYLLGRQEFWSLSLKVSADTLIPRPETELLVELTLATLPANEHCRVADLGTGSGAIALALASERSHWQVSATDISAAALKIAEQNRQAHQLKNVTLSQGVWLSALTGRFNAIISNPPYVAAGDKHLQQGDCRYEPAVALSPGGDGLAAFRYIAEQAGEYLLPGAWLLFEHGHDQANQLQSILLAAGLENIKTHQDLAAIDRVTIGQWPATMVSPTD